jgi:DNA polymerase V
MHIVDMLNRRYGRNTVRLAGMNPKGKWKTRAAECSPRYTTKLSEVPLLR